MSIYDDSKAISVLLRKDPIRISNFLNEGVTFVLPFWIRLRSTGYIGHNLSQFDWMCAIF